MTSEAIVIAILAVTAAAVLQGAVGFGMGLIVVPVLVWSGQPLPVAVAVLMGAGIFQTAHGTWVARAHVPWRLTFGLAGVQWLCLPLGVWAMAALSTHEPATVRQVVGIAVLLLVSTRLLARPVPAQRVGRGWAVAAAASSAVLAGVVGMGGPPLVLFAMAHDWDKQRFRGFLWSQFLLVLPFAITLLALRFGSDVLVWFAFGFACAPCLWLGTHAGLTLSQRWGGREVQRAATWLLYAIGLVSALSPWLGRGAG